MAIYCSFPRRMHKVSAARGLRFALRNYFQVIVTNSVERALDEYAEMKRLFCVDEKVDFVSINVGLGF